MSCSDEDLNWLSFLNCRSFKFVKDPMVTNFLYFSVTKLCSYARYTIFLLLTLKFKDLKFKEFDSDKVLGDLRGCTWEII